MKNDNRSKRGRKRDGLIDELKEKRLHMQIISKKTKIIEKKEEKVDGKSHTAIEIQIHSLKQNESPCVAAMQLYALRVQIIHEVTTGKVSTCK